MSVLPTGQRLDRFVPDLDTFLYDPATHLREAPLVIGPRKMYGLAGLFAAFALVCVLVNPYLPGTKEERQREVIAVTTCLLIGSMVWLSWSLMLRGHRLVLHPDGVEVRYNDTAVWCPWALFNAEGRAFVPDSDSPRAGVTVPINPNAVPFVQFRRNDLPSAFGGKVKGRQFHFSGHDEVVLPARYEVRAEDVGELLLQLGSRLGRQLPRETPPDDAYSGVAAAPPTALEADGFFTATLTRLAFPPRCCDCGETTVGVHNFRVVPGGDWVLGFFTSGTRDVTVAVPMCDRCRGAMQARQQGGGQSGMARGGAMGAVLAVLANLAQPGATPASLTLCGFFGVAVGGLIGFTIGSKTGARPPALFRGYSPSRGTLRVWFRDREYAREVLERTAAKITGKETL